MSKERDTVEGKEAGAFVVRGSGRLGGSFSRDLDLTTGLDDSDGEAVHRLASRFRKTSLQNIAIQGPSLEKVQGTKNPLNTKELEASVLQATSAPPAQPVPLPEQLTSELETTGDETMRVDVEKAIQQLDRAQSQEVNCPSCQGTTAADMPHCAQCGASLTDPDTPWSQRPHIHRREPPPPTARAQQRNKMPVSIVSIKEDGSDGKRVSLDFLETTIGRTEGVSFPTDSFLSPQHARLTIERGELSIEDLYSLNGTFLKLGDDVKLSPGDTFLMGRQVLRFERFEQLISPKTKADDGTRFMGSPPPGGEFKILQIGVGGVVQNVYCLPENGAVIGREKGDIIFPHDKFMSSRHAQIYEGRDGECYLVDLNSSNGTWIKIWEKTKIGHGHYIFVGQQLFRLEVSQ